MGRLQLLESIVFRTTFPHGGGRKNAVDLRFLVGRVLKRRGDGEAVCLEISIFNVRSGVHGLPIDMDARH